MAGEGKENLASFTLGTWIVVASYMSWTAGRFIFNAGPPMAVVGGVGLTAMWAYAEHRIRKTLEENRNRIAKGQIQQHILCEQVQTRGSCGYYGPPHRLLPTRDLRHRLRNTQGRLISRRCRSGNSRIMPDVLRYEVLGFSVLNSNQYSPDERCSSGCWYLGTFGPGFNGGDGIWHMSGYRGTGCRIIFH